MPPATARRPISPPCRLAAVTLVMLVSPVTLAGDSEEYLTGDWGGRRTKMAESGVVLSLNYIGEVMRVTGGGLAQKGEYLSRTDLGVRIDTDKLMDLSGGTFQFTFMHTDGGQPNNHVGALQGLSNIESPQTSKLIEAWYEQANELASLRFGLYDLNSEFDVTETAKLFNNPSFGIGAEYAQSGVNGPSIFPTTSLALRARYKGESDGYIQAAVLDAVPGKPGSPQRNYVRIDPEQEGWLYALETGYQTSRDDNSEDRYVKIAIGGWRYSLPLTTDVNGNTINERQSQGGYVTAEMQLYRAAAKGMRGLHGFLRYGVADEQLLQIGDYAGAGLNYIGLFPGRGNDQLGIGVASARNGKTWLSANPGMEERETIWELAYRAQIRPWFHVQPDIQYIEHPGTNPAVENATVVSLRGFVAF